jgi:hypothetical protein
MKNNNLKVVPLRPQDKDFDVLTRVTNTPSQQARREARRKMVRREALRKKAIHLGLAFLSGISFTLAMMTILGW